MTISLEVLARVRGTASKSTDAGTVSLPINESCALSLANGTGADQANLHYIDGFSIASGGNTTYDVAGSLSDDLGQSAVFSAIKAIMVIADDTNTTDLTIGNGTNGFDGPFDDATATVTLKPGACMLITNPSAAGWAITGGSNDVIKIANGSGATATGTLVVIGES